MEQSVMQTENEDLIETWRKLQTSDHFYYMCTKWSEDGDVHAYFSPYQSPYDAYIAFMNALSDLQLRVQHVVAQKQLEQRRGIEEVAVTKDEQSLWERLLQWGSRTLAKIRSFFNRIVNKFYANKSHY